MSYDKQCFELAQAFMADYPTMKDRENRTKELAEAIQETIEREIEDFEDTDSAAYYRAQYDAEKATQCDSTDPRSQAHAERMYEAADLERKRLREEG